jgi:hypothetical protein
MAKPTNTSLRLAFDHAAHVIAPLLIAAPVANDTQIVRAAKHFREFDELAAIPFLAARRLLSLRRLRLTAWLLRRRRQSDGSDQRSAKQSTKVHGLPVAPKQGGSVEKAL